MAKSYIFDANKTTPEEVARRRKIAEALAGPYRPSNVGEGLSAIGAAFGSRIASNRASKAEQAGQAHASEAMSPILEGFFGGAPASPDAGGVPAPAPIGGAEQDSGQGMTQAYEVGKQLVGMGEVPDKATISEFLKNGGQNLDPATTAWCAAFVNSSLAGAGMEGTGKLNARSFLDWGQPVDKPQKGDVAVFSRGDPNGWKGHVGFFDSYGEDGSINVLGGNQGDAVSVAGYSPDQLLGFRRAGQPQPVQTASAGPTSLRDGVRAAYASLSPATASGGGAVPSASLPPEAAGPQVAQNDQWAGMRQPTQQAPQPKLGQSMVGLPTLLKAAQDPWVAKNPLYSGIINQLIGIELKARMPMSEAEKMDMDMKRLQLEKTALEIGQMRNPKPETTDDIREYQFAVEQGYKGTLPQFMTEMKRAGSSSVTVNNGGSSEYNKALDKNFADQYISIQEGAQAARNKLATLQGLGSALGQTDYTGFGAETALAMKQAGRALGLDIGEDLGPQETARALGNQLALQLRSPSSGAGMPGAMSDKDREFLVASVPGLTKTPQGNQRLIDYMTRVEQRNIEVAKLAQDYSAKHGQIDNGFYQALSDWSAQNPLFPEAGQKQDSPAQIDGYTIERVQ